MAPGADQTAGSGTVRLSKAMVEGVLKEVHALSNESWVRARSREALDALIAEADEGRAVHMGIQELMAIRQSTSKRVTHNLIDAVLRKDGG